MEKARSRVSWSSVPPSVSGHDPHFGVFYDLMAFKVREILLVSSAYDAYIMEEDGSLAMRIINEYRGLNLSRPPRITRVSSVEKALEMLEENSYDLILTMPYFGGMDCATFAGKVKKRYPQTPVILLARNPRDAEQSMEDKEPCVIDDRYIWCCDSSILMAIVKSVEDRRNVDFDTARAMVRVILYVEDSPVHRSRILPILYHEVVRQTQAVLDEGLNDQHRLLKMRARPKILVAGSYEEAMDLVTRYRHTLYALLTDVRFARGGRATEDAGIMLITEIRREVRDLPVLVMSADAQNKEKALSMQAMFVLKDAATIREDIHGFFLNYLGFGDFIFRLPDGAEIGRASNLFEFEQMLRAIPDDSLMYHARRNHFSHWVMARAEIALASRLNRRYFTGVDDPACLREDILFKVHALRRLRQKGIVTQFLREGFDPEVTDFVRIGQGSMGGKARGIAFISSQLQRPGHQDSLLSGGRVHVPRTCVITTEGFDDFITHNHLHPDDELSDAEIAHRFESAEMPEWLLEDLRAYLAQTGHPLSVRSSSMLEDAQAMPYAGLYSTYMLANADPDFAVRFSQLVRAVKLVYASTWFEGPRSFSRSINQQNEDAMAVIIQRLAGGRYGDHFYPAISGTIQSYNFYPLAPMKQEDGIAHIALGFGKTVVEGERSLRFSPKYPENLPHMSTAEDMLKNTQRWFYSLDCGASASFFPENSNLVRRELDDAADEYPVRFLSSTYFPEEQRVRDVDQPGPKILTFAALLKHNFFPLSGIMNELVALGREGLGSEVEIEFALDLADDPAKSTFSFLQIRPIAAAGESREVAISGDDRAAAVIYSARALGHGMFQSMADILYVKPENFDAAATRDIASEISRMNRSLAREGRKMLLVGFGRWGTADPWLGIPVKWHDISASGAIVEIQGRGVTAEPSQGAHFFHNITSLGIPYLMVQENMMNGQDAPEMAGSLDWSWLTSREIVEETEHVCHVRLKKPFILKADGHTSQAVVLDAGDGGGK
ncbi:MAG: phosphoenolpyruvate synthase/pyruvate phosphate dikinase [Desulfobulbaceae bacterium]|nr:phosphoenolpyruvate synthase/pyruvate phosphate dikinase [Desulfobulbaceae bacterium]